MLPLPPVTTHLLTLRSVVPKHPRPQQLNRQRERNHPEDPEAPCNPQYPALRVEVDVEEESAEDSADSGERQEEERWDGDDVHGVAVVLHRLDVLA